MKTFAVAAGLVAAVAAQDWNVVYTTTTTTTTTTTPVVKTSSTWAEWTPVVKTSSTTTPVVKTSATTWAEWTPVVVKSTTTPVVQTTWAEWTPVVVKPTTPAAGSYTPSVASWSVVTVPTSKAVYTPPVTTPAPVSSYKGAGNQVQIGGAAMGLAAIAFML